MTDKAYEAQKVLRQYRDADRRITELYERIARLREAGTRATSTWSATRASGTGNRSNVENAAISAVDLELQLDGEIDRLNLMRRQIQDAIDQMEDERLKRLLELRYIDHRSWTYIMIRMEIERRWSFILHERALEAFHEKYF
jgi:hypothetical protein